MGYSMNMLSLRYVTPQASKVFPCEHASGRPVIVEPTCGRVVLFRLADRCARIVLHVTIVAVDRQLALAVVAILALDQIQCGVVRRVDRSCGGHRREVIARLLIADV